MITKNNQYDAIVIGSGMGGLATASLLAQIGKKRVLVLEKHFKLGGFTHSFQRKGYEWDVGVHYVGEMYPEAMARKIMDIVTGHELEWESLGTPYERFVFPEGTFEVPQGAKKFEAALVQRFPAEESGIRKYFKDVKKAQGWCARWFVSKQYSAPIDYFITMGSRRLSLLTTGEYLSRFKDPLLRAILGAQWPDFGSPPKESAFAFHSTVTADFFEGAYHPVGGAQRIATCAKEKIEQAGGDCLVNHAVESILIENKKACGVRAIHKGKEVEFRAPIIISNAGAINTFQKMVPAEFCSSERAKSQRLKFGTSALILFLGIKDDPTNYGFDNANYWIYERLDHDTHAKYQEGVPDRIDGAFLSFRMQNDGGKPRHTAQIISFSDKNRWAQFASKPWMKRGEEYEVAKAEVTEELLDFVERNVPGVRSLVDFAELSTPLTVESFTSHAGGMIYGQACDQDRLTNNQWKIKTSLKNLYLTGSDVGTPGVNGALMAAVMTAAKILGPFGLPKIFTQAYMGKKHS